MRVAAPCLRSLLCLVVFAFNWAVPTRSHGQPINPVARGGWRVGGNVTATARLGNVLYLGGNFRGVAPEGNVAGGILAVDATSGLPVAAAKFVGNVLAIESDGAGGWYVGGNYVEVVSGGTLQSRIRLVHLLPNGELDPAFTATAGGAVRALEFVPGVGLFVGGDFTTLNGSARERVGLLNATTGALDPWTYTIAGTGATVRALAHDAGALVIGGTFATVNGTARTNLAVVSATASGQLGPGFPADGIVEVLMVAPAGSVYIGGGFNNLSSAPRSRLARATLTAATRTLALDTWNPGLLTGNVRALAAGAGTIFAGGDFVTVGGAGRQRVVELDVATAAPTAFAPQFNGSVNALALDNGRLFVVGAFSHFSDLEGRYGAAAVTVATGALLPWNPGPVGTTSALAVTGTTVVLGGSIVGFGAVGRTNLAAVDLQSGAILTWNPDPDGNQIDEILVHGNSLYISGNFRFLRGDLRQGVAQVDPIFGEALDFDAQITNGAVTAMLIDGNSLYLGGSFTAPRMRLAKFDLTTGALDPAFTPTVAGTVNDLVISGGTLFLGGTGIGVNGGAVAPLAVVNTATGAVVPGFTFSANDTVQKMDLDGGFLYVAGNFSSVNFTPRDGVARVSPSTGALDTTWAPDLENPASIVIGVIRSVNDVNAENGVVILAGAFETVGGQNRFGVATVDTVTGAPTAWAPQLGTPPLGGFGSAILTAPDLTVIGGNRIQLADDLFNGLALFVESSAVYVLPPTNLSATINGGTITFTWAMPPLGLAGVSFILEAGTASGLANLGTLNIGTVTSFTVNSVPPGTYYIRVRAVHASGTSAPTPDLAVTVGGTGCTSPPPPPIDFDMTYDDNGGILELWWFTAAGSAPTSYLLQAGTAPGLTNLGTLPVPGSYIQIPGVPPGNYWLQVRAVNGCGISPPSPSFPLVLDESAAPPLAPPGFTGTAAGGVIQLSWLEPPFLAPTSYLLEAGSAPGLSNLAVLPLTATSFSVGGVPPGVYYLRVRGVNAAGVGAPSAEVRLVVP